NLPAVGLHDVLMVLASGHHAALKLSSQDKALMQLYVFAMQSFDAEVPVSIIERLQGMDAVIATGSDFSGGYFAHYFSTIPHIIRKNRSSLAVLKGNEKQEDFKGLAQDIFTYYGLGCRNVSTIAVPATYDLTPLFDELTKETWVLAHSKYSNNFQYHRTLFLLNQVPHFDLGNLLVTENDDLVSPVGVLYVHRYSDEASLLAWIQEREEKIQCKVGLEIGFGQSQHPALDDFADGIDTYDFLINLS
ncbi:MAG: acyl-CoA reductase, partial [Aquirufa sp.]